MISKKPVKPRINIGVAKTKKTNKELAIGHTDESKNLHKDTPALAKQIFKISESIGLLKKAKEPITSYADPRGDFKLELVSKNHLLLPTKQTNYAEYRLKTRNKSYIVQFAESNANITRYASLSQLLEDAGVNIIKPIYSFYSEKSKRNIAIYEDRDIVSIRELIRKGQRINIDSHKSAIVAKWKRFAKGNKDLENYDVSKLISSENMYFDKGTKRIVIRF